MARWSPGGHEVPGPHDEGQHLFASEWEPSFGRDGIFVSEKLLHRQHQPVGGLLVGDAEVADHPGRFVWFE
ncbi:uncharacterized protein METZ01_LOCUS166643, partial [marine metagenome]